ncbi:hypothetical protein J2W56_006603 [Nocardia kruczakiae]|uniref:Uncharacterized protein n=1 Tax=Nocardia kruczakiae TaxID=261477 RepID=A0ABU1XQJ2_9NOCA|nr:hypothetical protein [Nocardia kruczakiae]MDR7172837.1 hypothetical protein [Nocardia kruczakiae]
MLQVITGMYFRAVELHETVHRRTLYSNVGFLNKPRVELPIGHLTPATDWSASIHTSLACFTERLEAVRPDGTEEFMLSTGGTDILDDLAAVLSFALDATFTSVYEKAERLIGPPTGRQHNPAPADILPRTFTPRLAVDEHDLADLHAFMTALIGLNRRAFDAAMRTIRRIVVATERVAEDPTLAYTDFVAALESLSAEAEVPSPTWDRLDSRKRKLLDPALDDLEASSAERIRAAILESERAGIKHRYIEFVISHVQPSYFGEQARGTVHPISGPRLRRAVAAAYDARSKNLHELRELTIGTWMSAGGAESVTPAKGPTMLTHQGLNRLARHVVRTYVERAPRHLCTEFVWRDHLPNVVEVRLAPMLYLGHAEAMAPQVSADRAGEFLGLLIEALSEREHWSIDMRPALGRIEQLLKSHRKPSIREPMLMIYLLWHRIFPSPLHRPAPQTFLTAAERELSTPSMYSFATAVLLQLDPPWTIEEICELAERRYEALHGPRPDEMPSRLDAALWVVVAQQILREDNAHSTACAALARAIECAPGDTDLLALQGQITTGSVDVEFDVRTYVIGPPHPKSGETNTKPAIGAE